MENGFKLYVIFLVINAKKNALQQYKLGQLKEE